MSDLAYSCVHLPDLAVLQCQGADAVSFLHNQLSNDIIGLPNDQACLAAYCSPKGRVLATLVVWRAPATDGDTCYALVKADIAQTLVKRLSLFILRAKANISIAAHTVHASVMPALPDSPAPWSLWRTQAQVCIRAPGADATQQRIWCVGLKDAACAPCADTVVQGEARAEVWRAADIAAGLPWVGADNQDVHIAQTLNLDLIGAINFTKGCYPGQEVVARSHYRGTIKRRMAYGITAALDVQVHAGMDVYKAGEASPCGRVINVAHTELCHALLEVHLADLPDTDFRLGNPAGAAITLRALPYRIAPEQTT